VSTPLRRAVERRSAPILVYLRSVPGSLLFVVMLGLVLGGLLAPAPVGASLLAVLAALIGWIAYLAWPVLSPGGRLARVATLLIVLAAAAQRAISG
jgi:hypothetical protein